MSQRIVEWVIGRLVADEAFRSRFAKDPRAALEEITCRGCELTSVEMRALASIDWKRAAWFAETIDPRIQKADIQGGPA